MIVKCLEDRISSNLYRAPSICLGFADVKLLVGQMKRSTAPLGRSGLSRACQGPMHSCVVREGARVQHRMTRRKKKKRVRNGQVSQPLVPYTEADFPNPHATDRRVGKSSQYQVLTRSDVLTEGTRKIKQNRGDAFLFCHDHGDAVPRARRVLSTNDLRKFQVWRQGNQAALRSTPA